MDLKLGRTAERLSKLEGAVVEQQHQKTLSKEEPPGKSSFKKSCSKEKSRKSKVDTGYLHESSSSDLSTG